MAKKQTEFDPHRLTQTQLAAATGKRPSWLREHSDLVPRNLDGTYDLPAVIKALAGQIEPAELHPDDVERALQSYEATFCDGLDGRDAAQLVQLFDSIDQRHGPRGLLAVFKVWIELMGRDAAAYSSDPIPSEVDIRLRHEVAIVAEVEEAMRWKSLNPFDAKVCRCTDCGRHRWGREWHQENPRPQLEVVDDVCPPCWAKFLARTK